MVFGLDFGFHNIMTCGGWATKATAMGPVGLDIGGPCSMAKLGLVLLFFIVALTRKWGGEEVGLDFNFWWSLGLSFLAYFLVVTFTGSTQVAMFAGIVGMLIGGYAIGFLLGGSEDGYSD
jgi:hypothetical protein